jgi:hypothetical protein
MGLFDSSQASGSNNGTRAAITVQPCSLSEAGNLDLLPQSLVEAFEVEDVGGVSGIFDSRKSSIAAQEGKRRRDRTAIAG